MAFLFLFLLLFFTELPCLKHERRQAAREYLSRAPLCTEKVRACPGRYRQLPLWRRRVLFSLGLSQVFCAAHISLL